MAAGTSLSSDDMGRLRTEMAADRTLMAWVRTGLSMISFGFTIHKFFQYLYQSNPNAGVVHNARNLTLMLTGLAFLGLVAGVFERQHTMKTLGATRSFWSSLPVMTAIATAAIAAFVFIGALWPGIVL